MRCSICLAALAAGFLIPSTSALPLSVAGQIPQQIRAVSSPGQPLELGFTSRRAQRQSRSSSGRIRSRALGLDPRQAADAEAQLWNLDDTRYIVDVTVAGQDLQVILDSGSTDTYVYSVQPSNQVYTASGESPPIFQNSTASPLLSTGLTYNASYGSGNGVTSTLGAIQLTDIALDTTSLVAQNISFANLYKTSNGVGASGSLGLGFPMNGNIFPQAVQALYAQTGRAVPQSTVEQWFPIVPFLSAQNQIPSALYSLVVTRLGPQPDNNPRTSGGTLPVSTEATLSNGSLTLGGYPSGYSESDFVWSSVPVVTVSESYRKQGFPDSTGNRWTTRLEAIYFNGAKLLDSQLQEEDNSDGQPPNYALIDTGNPIIHMATDVLAQITDAWAGNPDNYVLPCNTPFSLIFQFAGTNFTLSNEDVLVPSVAAIDSSNYGGYATTDCQVQMQPFIPTRNELGPGTSMTHQLGDVFLRNVISAYDYGDLFNAASNPPRIGFISTTPAAS